jgi:hypothetical protein
MSTPPKITTTYTLQLPNKDGTTETLTTNGSVLLVGANGSGKTRLGTWIELESPQKEKVHRVSAQKSLAMPESSTPISIERAERALLYGNPNVQVPNASIFKQGSRWNSKPAITMLNDFEQLMVFLFSDHTEESSKYLAASKLTDEKVKPPVTKLDLVKETWEKLLPHRELVLGGLRIQTRARETGSQPYSSSEMSDGERVIFYLIGQCLAVPKDGIIVIDEPELHLHKSIQLPLWSEVERLRPDCLFVYLTHDVDFAAAQESAIKIWIKSFNGKLWDWQIIPEVQGLPDELLIEILGSRKSVVFVEGTKGSLDAALYNSVLAGFLVISRGSCHEVIQAVKALRSNQGLHHLNIFGLIDRDRRGDAEIEMLQKDGVYTLEVAEVENLFAAKEVLALVSQRLSRNHDDDFKAASAFLFERLKGELETQVSLHAVGEVSYKLNMFDKKAKGEAAIEAALQQLVKGIDVSAVYKQAQAIFDKVLSQKDYSALLKFYNRKSLSSGLSTYFGLAGKQLPEFVVRLAKGSDGDEIRARLEPYLGAFAAVLKKAKADSTVTGADNSTVATTV